MNYCEKCGQTITKDTSPDGRIKVCQSCFDKLKNRVIR